MAHGQLGLVWRASLSTAEGRCRLTCTIFRGKVGGVNAQTYVDNRILAGENVIRHNGLPWSLLRRIILPRVH